jgi:membrane associated rhomboid family serine protease
MNDFRYTRPNAFPPVIKNLLIVNVLVFIAQQTIWTNSETFNNLFALHDIHSVYFKPHQILTYMFMHGGIDHILFNMLALWMFGSQLENYWGGKRFLTYYILCGLGAAVLHLIVLYLEMAPVMAYFKNAADGFSIGNDQFSKVQNKYANCWCIRGDFRVFSGVWLLIP